MNVLIIEDEKLAADDLIELLHSYDSSITVLAVLDSVKSSIEWLTHNSCDLIFLDIQLSDDISFSIFKKINVQTPVIFCTAYDQYAIRAFTLNSIDYLLKPIDFSRLSAALTKFQTLQQPAKQPDISMLLDAMRNMQVNYQKRFSVHSGEQIISIPTTDIAYFYAQHRYVILFTKTNEQYIIDYTLDKLEQVLDPDVFFRINRQFILSFQSIKSMLPYTKGRIKIEVEPSCKEETIVSIDRASRFKDWLNR